MPVKQTTDHHALPMNQLSAQKPLCREKKVRSDSGYGYGDHFL